MERDFILILKSEIARLSYQVSTVICTKTKQGAAILLVGLLFRIYYTCLTHFTKDTTVIKLLQMHVVRRVQTSKYFFAHSVINKTHEKWKLFDV